MANVCEYRVTASGPKEQLEAIVAFLAPAIAPCPGGYYSPNILDLDKLWPDLNENREHEWIGVGSFGDEPGDCFGWVHVPSVLESQRQSHCDPGFNQMLEFITTHEGDIRRPRSFWTEIALSSANVLAMKGACKWSPPKEFLCRLSVLFADVLFRCIATTEHEAHSQFVVTNGELSMIDEWVENCQSGRSTWYWRAGEQRDPPEEEYDGDELDERDIAGA